jgi:hypothetical protein
MMDVQSTQYEFLVQFSKNSNATDVLQLIVISFPSSVQTVEKDDSKPSQYLSCQSFRTQVR